MPELSYEMIKDAVDKLKKAATETIPEYRRPYRIVTRAVKEKLAETGKLIKGKDGKDYLLGWLEIITCEDQVELCDAMLDALPNDCSLVRKVEQK